MMYYCYSETSNGMATVTIGMDSYTDENGKIKIRNPFLCHDQALVLYQEQRLFYLLDVLSIK